MIFCFSCSARAWTEEAKAAAPSAEWSPRAPPGGAIREHVFVQPRATLCQHAPPECNASSPATPFVCPPRASPDATLVTASGEAGTYQI